MSAIYTLLAILLGAVCVFMILLILVQKGRGGGLSGAFGGAGGNTAFGTKTGDLLTWVTATVFFLFLLLTMGLTWTGDYLNARYNNASSSDVVGDDASEGDTPLLDADGDGEVELIPPSDDQSSLPTPPPVVEPGIKPSADGTTDEGDVEN